MANARRWDGTCIFVPELLPLKYYNDDAVFRDDAVGFAHYAAAQLGYPNIGVELAPENMFAAYEAAVNEYSGALYRSKIQDNWISYEGSPLNGNLNENLTTPTLGQIIRIAKTYGSEAGSGGNVTWYSGSIKIEAGRQNYNLKQWAAISGSLAAGDSIEIKRVFHQGVPASVRWLDPTVGLSSEIGGAALDIMGWSNTMGTPINYLMSPVSQDIARFQAIEFSDEVRRSAHSFELIDNQLKIFPIPYYDSRIWFQYIKVSERDTTVNPNNPGSGVITNPSNVPFGNIKYSTINAPGRQWIQAYATALVKLTLANIRNKFQTLPIPGSEVTLNGSSLETQATNEINALKESLQTFLEGTTKQVQLEKAAIIAEQTRNTLSYIPMYIYTG